MKRRRRRIDNQISLGGSLTLDRLSPAIGSVTVTDTVTQTRSYSCFSPAQEADSPAQENLGAPCYDPGANLITDGLSPYSQPFFGEKPLLGHRPLMDHTTKTPSIPVLLLLILISIFQLLSWASFRLGQAVGGFYFANRREIHATARFVGRVALVAGEFALVVACHAARAAYLFLEDQVHIQLGDYAPSRWTFTAYEAEVEPLCGVGVASSIEDTAGDWVVAEAAVEKAALAAISVTGTVTVGLVTITATVTKVKAVYNRVVAVKEDVAAKARPWVKTVAKLVA